jgi:hypothetical protein
MGYPWDIRVGHWNWRLLAILKDFSYSSSLSLDLDVCCWISPVPSVFVFTSKDRYSFSVYSLRFSLGSVNHF